MLRATHSVGARRSGCGWKITPPGTACPCTVVVATAAHTEADIALLASTLLARVELWKSVWAVFPHSG